MSFKRRSPLAICVRATLFRLRLRIELVVILAVIAGIGIQFAMLPCSVLTSFNYEFGVSPNRRSRWHRSIEEFPAGQKAVVRRPMWCGAVYVVVPSERVSQSDDTIPVVRNPPLHIWPRERIPRLPDEDPEAFDWYVYIWPLIAPRGISGQDRRILIESITSESEYAEAVILGWPFRIASASGHALLGNADLDGYFTITEPHLAFGHNKTKRGHVPRHLLNTIPLRFHGLGILGNAVVYGAAITFAYGEVLFAHACVRLVRGRCPRCGYRFMNTSTQCTECGCLLPCDTGQ